MPIISNAGASAPTPPALPSVRQALRLVVNRTATTAEVPASMDLPAVPCLLLKSACADKNIVNESELIELFKSLRQGERIEFCHSFHWDENGNAPAGQPFRLRIRVAAANVRLEALKAQVSACIASALPDFYFVEGGTLAATELRHTAQFALAGVIATERPAARRYGDDCDHNPTLKGLLNAKARSREYRLPFPADLPSWALTAPFADPMTMPPSTELCIRVHGFTLDEQSCQSIHRTLFRIESGNFVVYHPESPIADYSIATQMKEPMMELLRVWLQRPSGFAVDCVIRSSQPLSEAAEKRIVGDVFGKRPYTRVRAYNAQEPQSLAPPEFAWAIAAGQGLPALLPGCSVLSSLGVARHYLAPPVLPASPGTRIGTTVCGRRSAAVTLPHASRSRHVAVVGATGSGKSSLFTRMMATDIADPERRCGIGLIDPHGGLYQKVLAMVPPSRADDVVLVDTGDMISSPCLNPLEGLQGDPMQANFIVSELMSLIDLLLESKDSSGPMTRSNLRNLLMLTSGVKGRHPCIMDAVRVLEDKDYAEYLLANCRDRNVVDYWKNFMNTSSSHTGYTEWGPYMMARLTPFVASPIMKRLINRPDSTIDLGRAMQDGKIVLFNLNKGVLNDIECQVLGSLILSRFFAAALGRGLPPYTAPVQRVPAIEDLNFMRDMRRMTQ